MRALFLSMFFWCVVPFPGTTSATAGEADYPRLANYYLHGHVDYSHLVELAKWDVVILNTVWTEQELAALRGLNPDIKIYLYICAYCIESPANPKDTWSVQLHRYAEDHQLWWYDTEGEIASDWPRVKMINVTSPIARGPIGDWLTFLERMIQQLVKERPSIDGVFFDNYWRQISWNQANLRLDSDCHPVFNPDGCDGVADSRSSLDYYWNDAMRQFARRVRTTFDLLETNRSRPLSIISNSSSDYFESLNGTLYEFFPTGAQVDYGGPHAYAWREGMFQWPGGYQLAPFRNAPYRVSVINASWAGTTLEPARTQGFERHKRFTFGSTLLGDGYFSFDEGPQGHGNLWWEPEYDNSGAGKGYLGQPTGEARSIAPRGVTNLITNGDFSRDLDEWTTLFANAEGDGVVTSSPGGHLMQLSMRRLLHPAGQVRLSHGNIRIAQNKAHTLRFTAQAISPTEIEVQLTSNECPGNNCIRTWHFGVSSVPQEYAVSFIAPASAAATLSLTLRSPSLVRLQNVSLLNGSQDIYRRDFENGAVVVNYTTETQLVSLDEPLTRLSVPGSLIYDGRTVSMDYIASGDAMIYLKPPAVEKSTQQHGSSPGSSTGSGVDGLHLTIQTHRSETSIGFELAQPTLVGVRVFDVRGRLVQEIQPLRPTTAGTHQLLWQGDDSTSRPVAPGVYFIQLHTPGFSTQQKRVVLR